MSIRKYLIGAIAAIASFGAVSSANAVQVIIDPGETKALNSSLDFYSADVDPTGAFSDVFTFQNNIGSNTTLNFIINTTQIGGDPTGVTNLTFTFSGPGGNVVFADLTNAAGVLAPSPALLSYFFGTAADTILTVTGATVGGFEASYDFDASVVPLPPALLLFGSALGGMGWLSRRRRPQNGSAATSAA